MSNQAANSIDRAIVRFAGDSGDGMQLVGGRFTHNAALAGNDLATFPDFPAEIRAPAGSLGGVSAFQIQFANTETMTAGDAPHVLIAMNPAALKTNLPNLQRGGAVIVDSGAFSRKNLKHAGYDDNPLEGESLSGYRLVPVDMTALTLAALESLALSRREALRCRNFFALGLVYWLYQRAVEDTLAWMDRRFADQPVFLQANRKALLTGYHYGETAELSVPRTVVEPARLEPGLYRTISGNEALGFGLLAAADLSGLELFLASYPITPASDILHFMARHREYGVRVFQAEDEMAAASAAIGAAYAGALAVTTTSGPGMALKSEALGLAVSLELPMVVIDVQRAGPSTGLPTKTEQSDLYQALYGRSGEAPLPVLAARSPSDCFWTVIEAAQLAIARMTPVVVLSDASVANGAEPWKIPDLAAIPRFQARFAQDGAGFQPYARDPDLVRPWAIPGTPDLQHRIGGLEKESGSGNVSYDPLNHAQMSELRQRKVAGIVDCIEPTDVFGDRAGGILVLGWGGTYGAIRAAVKRHRARGHAVSHVHVRHLNPLPGDLGQIVSQYDKVLVPELNFGQFAGLMRKEYLIELESYTKLEGRPFTVNELDEAIAKLGGPAHE